MNKSISDALEALTKASAPLVSDEELAGATALLSKGLTDEDIAAANQYLHEIHPKVRKLAMVDFAAMLVIHAKSVQQNDGYSPYSRFTRWSHSEKNTFTGHWENAHVRVVMTLFQALKLTTQLAESKRQQCRKYSIHDGLLRRLLAPTPKIQSVKR